MLSTNPPCQILYPRPVACLSYTLLWRDGVPTDAAGRESIKERSSAFAFNVDCFRRSCHTIRVV